MHFSDELAMHASHEMKNADGKDHAWSVADVKGAYASLGYTLRGGYTWGDVTYMANLFLCAYV